MREVVILSKKGDDHDELKAMIRMVFPECKIRIIKKCEDPPYQSPEKARIGVNEHK